MRLIDANELIEHMYLGTEYDKTVDDNMEKTEAINKAFKCGWNDALASVMDYAPTVDAVEVVRCKDCKSLIIINEGKVYAVCKKHRKIFRFFGEDTREHYCSWGERREDADE